jgi:hypothetical protein
VHPQAGAAAEEQAGVDVPRMDVLLEEADVDAPGRRPRELEGGAAERDPPARAPVEPLREQRGALGARVCRALGAAGDDRRGQRPRRWARRGRAVDPQRTAACAREQLAAQQVEDRARDGARTVLAGDAHAEERDPGEEVHGPVERVDDPAQAGRAWPVARPLLGQDAVVGPPLGQHAGDRGLRGAVRIRGGVHDAALPGETGRLVAEPRGQLGARRVRRGDRDAEHVARHGRSSGDRFPLHI